MDRRPTPAPGTRFNWWLPSVYAAAIVLTGALGGSGRATGLVAAVGAVLLGLYYGFGQRLRGRR